MLIKIVHATFGNLKEHHRLADEANKNKNKKKEM